VKANLCKVGVDPNYWYPVLREKELAKGKALPVTFSQRRLVVFRDQAGQVHTLDNSCAHRKVALHTGEVRDCRIVCPYHGWEYESAGKLVGIPYWEADKKIPNIKLRNYPTQCRNGLIWIFPGDFELADAAAIPDTSALENKEWFSFRLDNDFYNHYSIGIINGMDYYHFHLHRKFQPWSDIRLVKLQSEENSVFGEYEIVSTRGRAARFFKTILGEGGSAQVVESLKVHYLYPHHLAEVGEKIKVRAYFLPVNEKHVKAFITMYVRASGIHRFFRKPFQTLFSPLILKRIQVQDAWIGLQEQEAWELYPHEPRCETNPISIAVEKLLVQKWMNYSEKTRKGKEIST
jgi:phenylpropionate dioxygenase-like ring-hydroxylating dioxygenase large terminal subunit